MIVALVTLPAPDTLDTSAPRAVTPPATADDPLAPRLIHASAVRTADTLALALIEAAMFPEPAAVSAADSVTAPDGVEASDPSARKSADTLDAPDKLDASAS